MNSLDDAEWLILFGDVPDPRALTAAFKAWALQPARLEMYRGLADAQRVSFLMDAYYAEGHALSVFAPLNAWMKS